MGESVLRKLNSLSDLHKLVGSEVLASRAFYANCTVFYRDTPAGAVTLVPPGHSCCFRKGLPGFPSNEVRLVPQSGSPFSSGLTFGTGWWFLCHTTAHGCF